MRRETAPTDDRSPCSAIARAPASLSMHLAPRTRKSSVDRGLSNHVYHYGVFLRRILRSWVYGLRHQHHASLPCSYNLYCYIYASYPTRHTLSEGSCHVQSEGTIRYHLPDTRTATQTLSLTLIKAQGSSSRLGVGHCAACAPCPTRSNERCQGHERDDCVPSEAPRLLL